MRAQRSSAAVHPRYSISQNFLTSAALIKRLIHLTSIGPGDLVLEIGAGKGHITRQLAAHAGRVQAMEIDPALCIRLFGMFSDHPGVFIHDGDFLKAPLPRGKYKVFSNIPFSITTAIVDKLTTGPNPPQGAWLVMEKGAAMRFMGTPRETSASLRLKTAFDMRIVHRFAREDFHPMPGVDVVMLELKKKPQPDLPGFEREAFCGFVEQCKRAGFKRGGLTPAQVSRSLREAGLAQLPASGEMRYVQWLCLFRCSRRAR